MPFKFNPFIGTFDIDTDLPSAGFNIGSPVGGGTPGSILFVDPSGNVGQDNANLFFNDTTDFFGVGSNTPVTTERFRLNGRQVFSGDFGPPLLTGLNIGMITHSNINGIIIAGEGSTNDLILGNRAVGVIMRTPTGTLDAIFQGDIIPHLNNFKDIGTSTKKWNDGWFGGNFNIDGKLTVGGAIDPTMVLLSGADKRFGATDAGTVYLAPFTNSTTAVQVRKADNTTVITSVDTTNSRFFVGTTTPVATERMAIDGLLTFKGSPSLFAVTGLNVGVMGHSNVNGLIVGGEGSVDDFTLVNKDFTVVMRVPTGTNEVVFQASLLPQTSSAQNLGSAAKKWFDGFFAGNVSIGGNVTLENAGNKISIKEGTNASVGVATLVAGTVTVSNTLVTATSRIFLTGQNSSGTAGELTISARTASTDFTITSASATDTRSIGWWIVEPA